MPQCSAFECYIDSGGKRKEEGVSLHVFPLKRPALLRQWVRNVGKQNFKPKPNSRICSKHFLPECFVPNLYAQHQASLAKKSGKKYTRPLFELRDDAVPTEFAHRETGQEDNDEKVFERDDNMDTQNLNFNSVSVQGSRVFPVTVETKDNLCFSKVTEDIEDDNNVLGLPWQKDVGVDVEKTGSCQQKLSPDDCSLPHNSPFSTIEKLKSTNEGPCMCESDDFGVKTSSHDLVYSKPFKTKKGANILKRNNVKKTLFQCNFCLKTFTTKTFLTLHVRTHTKEKPFQCEFCMKAFSLKSDLTRHFRTHTKEKPFNCELCDKAFSRQSILTVHRRTHTKERPFQCKFCQKLFSRQSVLNQHIRTHTKERPFQCEFCNDKFSQRSSLIYHLNTHTKEKPFHCIFCDAAFTTEQGLTGHKTRNHTI